MENNSKLNNDVVDNVKIIRDMGASNGGIVTVKMIYITLNHNDEGKCIRRHLRTNFSNSHNHNDAWEWDVNNPILVDIIHYMERLSKPNTNTRQSHKRPQTVKTTVVSNDTNNGKNVIDTSISNIIIPFIGKSRSKTSY